MVAKNRLNSAEWKSLRSMFLKEVGFCQECGVKDCRLELHHRIPYALSKSNASINLMLVCTSCHRKLDHQFKKIYFLERKGKICKCGHKFEDHKFELNYRGSIWEEWNFWCMGIDKEDGCCQCNKFENSN